MHFKSTIRRLFAVLVIAGLALAPVARPAMAAPSSHGSMQATAHEMSSPATTDEMAEDMPCCPSKMPLDCDKCVFMAACMSKSFTGMTATVVHLSIAASDSVALDRNDSPPDGLGHPPPEYPPRILV